MMTNPGFGVAKSIKSFLQPEQVVLDEIAYINNSRLLIITLVAMPVHVLFIVIFSFFTDGSSESRVQWREGIILCHTFLLAMMAFFCALAWLGKKKGWSKKILTGINNAFMLLLLVSGAAITSVDQLVTSNITPFMLVCAILALGFWISPFLAGGLYLIAFVVFSYAMSVTQQDPSILLSNQINGFTSIALGFGLALMLWLTNTRNLIQRKTIETQQIDLQDKNVRLEFLASHDPLTELSNRREFDMLLKKEISRMERYGGEAAVIILDIDDFKAVNDTYGHYTGDLVLVQTANIILKNLRESDTVARWGGEEFIILLPEANLEKGALIAEKLRRILENNFMVINEKTIRVTASFGVAVLDSASKNKFELVYQQADKALYSAKDLGRNRIDIA